MLTRIGVLFLHVIGGCTYSKTGVLLYPVAIEEYVFRGKKYENHTGIFLCAYKCVCFIFDGFDGFYFILMYQYVHTGIQT